MIVEREISKEDIILGGERQTIVVLFATVFLTILLIHTAVAVAVAVVLFAVGMTMARRLYTFSDLTNLLFGKITVERAKERAADRRHKLGRN